MTYSEAIAWLEGLRGATWKGDLSRIRRLCAMAGNPQQRFLAALVGGSAGKGSTCTFLECILRRAGLRTGVAPKPHLFSYCERAQVDGRPISEERFAALMERERAFAGDLPPEMGRPTVFDLLTLLAFLHFEKSGVERAVVEVGLGGRLDSTNVLEPDLSVITLIDLDHTEVLGDTEEAIAREKAGILRPGGRAVTAAEGPALAVIEQQAAALGSGLWRLGREVRCRVTGLDETGGRFDLDTPAGGLADLRIRLRGEHQIRNAALAAAAALWLADRHLCVTPEAVRLGLESAELPGRLQVLQRGPLVLVDAAHSPGRAQALVAAIQRLYRPDRRGRVVLVLGCSEGHSPAAVVALLAPLADGVIATRSRHPRAVAPETIAAEVRRGGRADFARVVTPVRDAVAQARELAGRDGMVIVTGSLFVAAEALEG